MTADLNKKDLHTQVFFPPMGYKKDIFAVLRMNLNSCISVRFLVIFRLRRSDITCFARSDIAPLRSAVILYSPLTAEGNITRL